MKTTPLPSLAHLASWRFKFFPSTSTLIERRYNHRPALPFLRATPPRSLRLRVSLQPKSPLRPFATFAALRFILFFSLFPVTAHATRDLLVANPATNSILRFDGQTGASKGHFVATGAGGLINPMQMQQGPDGALYVVDWDGRFIRKFSSLDGSLIFNFELRTNVWCPQSLEFDDAGFLHVFGRTTASCSTRSLSIFDPNDGTFIRTAFTASTILLCSGL